MDILIIGLWIFLSLAIPVGLIYYAGNSYGGTKNWKIIGKLIPSFAAFISTCVITLFVLIILVVGPDPKPEQEMSNGEQIAALLVIYVYAFIGYLLCSFINGSFPKPWKMSFFNSKKPQSIFKE